MKFVGLLIFVIIVLIAIGGLLALSRMANLRAEAKTPKQQLDIAEGALREINADPDGAQTHAQIALNNLRQLRDRETF